LPQMRFQLMPPCPRIQEIHASRILKPTKTSTSLFGRCAGFSRPPIIRSTAVPRPVFKSTANHLRGILVCASERRHQGTAHQASMEKQVTQKCLTLYPTEKSIYLITRKILEDIPEIKNVQAGILSLFLKSTDAALTINENADPTVRTDLDAALDRLVDECASGEAEAAVAKTSLVGVSLDVPIQGGQLALGTWQGIYLCDFTGRAGGSGRELVATVMETPNVRDTRNVTLQAPSRGCHLSRSPLHDADLLPGLRQCRAGVLNVTIKHTSASLTINENADPTVRSDMEAAFNHLVPEIWNQEFFQHTMEGDDDMPAHVKSTLVGATVSIPVTNGSLQLGTWQGVYLCEHRNVGGFGSGHNRQVTVTLQNPGMSHQRIINVQAPSRGCHDITNTISSQVQSEIKSIKCGVMCLFIQHTSASLTCTDVTKGADLERMLNHVVPEKWNQEFFQHTYEGPDDMPGHVKSTLMGASLTVPITDGKLVLGEKQGIMLCEHRNMGGFGGGHRRNIVVTIQGQ